MSLGLRSVTATTLVFALLGLPELARGVEPPPAGDSTSPPGEEAPDGAPLDVPAERALLRIVVAGEGAFEVLVDGDRINPNDAVDVMPGRRLVELRRGDALLASREVDVAAGDHLEIVLTIAEPETEPPPEAPQALAAELEITLAAAADRDARVYIDDAYVGDTPWRGEMKAGTRRVRVERPGDFKREEVVALLPGTLTRLTVQPYLDPVFPSRFTYSARPLRPGRLATDLSGGWPLLFGVRLTGGIVEGFDLGVAVQNAFAVLTQFDLRGRLLVARSGVLAFGAQLEVDFGFGVRSRGSFAATPMALGSIAFGSNGVATLGLGVRVFSDRTGPADEPAHADRDSGIQLPLMFALEIAFSDSWSGFLHIEGNPLSQRRALLDQGYMSDTFFYGRVGGTFLF